VHGVILDFIGHAWLERNGVVYDAVKDREESAAAYYARSRAVVERRYAKIEACEHMARTGSWGPWHVTAGQVQGILYHKREDGEVEIVHGHRRRGS
jgi:hypothetical protein